MKKALIAISLILMVGILVVYSLKYYTKLEEGYQKDADIIRLEHLVYWTGLFEEYYQKTGKYPLQERLLDKDSIILVKINTQKQSIYFNPDSKQYRKDLDNNSNGFFQKASVKDLVQDLENKLGRNIDEKYDIQKVPSKSTIGYNYFMTEKGYLMWTPCMSCGVSPISTLLFDGFTPTVNITSVNMVPDVTKALERDDMMKHPIFQEWMSKEIQKKDYMRKLEESNFNDSKK